MSTATNFTPWHKVVTLRDDIRDMSQAVFAADLYDVVMNRGYKVYRDANEFFSLTYPTLNLRNLCRDVIWRLAGRSAKAIRQLELTYGGGKTHTLITLYHLTHHPEKLPNLPAVEQFTSHIELDIPRTQVIMLPFDKLDTDRGMEIAGPDGETRWLKHPWSLIAYQIAGDDGLRSLHADGLAQERENPPAENLLSDLLARPQREDMATLLLLDEVLMYARRRIDTDPRWHSRIIDFFQYLTQAVTKVSTCAMVASLLASDLRKSDDEGKRLTQELYAIFRREKDESIQPVEKEDVAEVLRRRFFTQESTADKERFRPHVTAAYRGIANLDDQSDRRRREVENRLFESYPFHPDLTEVFYSKWTQVEGFQRTRGVLRTFADALQESEQWDNNPLISANAFIGDPTKRGLSRAARELTSMISHEEYEGKKYDWSNAVENELPRARQIQEEHPGLKHREVEQAVFATFLHSQPLGKEAELRDIYVLIGQTRPDKIELNKALKAWMQTSWFLDERNIQTAPIDSSGEKQIAEKWRLGPRPNLTHMHHDTSSHITSEAIEQHLIEQIRACENLVEKVRETGAIPHKLPKSPQLVDDNTQFHFVILGPEAASMPKDPSDEAQYYIFETGYPDKPRVSKNFVLLVVPASDMLDATRTEIQKYLGWLEVERQLKGQDIDQARQALLKEQKNKSARSVTTHVRQMYNIVVALNQAGQIEAFRLPGNDGPLFDVVKQTSQARIKLDAIAAGSLLPGGPYDLWKEGDKSHQLSHLLNSFAKYPRMPRLLKIEPIEQTIFQGCKDGLLVLRVSKTGTTYWRQDVAGMSLSSSFKKELEVVLPQYAELSKIHSELLQPNSLPALWENDRLHLGKLYSYFSGDHVAVVHYESFGYDEEYAIPQASKSVVNEAVREAVRTKKLWLIVGEASLYGEVVPEEILTSEALLQPPPEAISIHQILPAELPEAWQEEITTAEIISRALSEKIGQLLPWAVISAVLDQAFTARILDRTSDSRWPCDRAGAKAVRIFLIKKVAGTTRKTEERETKEEERKDYSSSDGYDKHNVREIAPSSEKYIFQATLESIEVQNLGNKIASLKGLTIGKDLRVNVRIEFNSKDMPVEKLEQIKELLKEIAPELILSQE